MEQCNILKLNPIMYKGCVTGYKCDLTKELDDISIVKVYSHSSTLVSIPNSESLYIRFRGKTIGAIDVDSSLVITNIVIMNRDIVGNNLYNSTKLNDIINKYRGYKLLK